MTHKLIETALLEQLVGALETAATGLEWYKDTHPESVDGSDDEANDEIEEAITAGRAALEGAERVGWQHVPTEPTQEMWAHLARDIVFWLYTCSAPHYGSKLHDFLRNCGTAIPKWLSREIPDCDSTPAKGTVAVCIYRAMLEAAPKESK